MFTKSIKTIGRLFGTCKTVEEKANDAKHLEVSGEFMTTASGLVGNLRKILAHTEAANNEEVRQQRDLIELCRVGANAELRGGHAKRKLANGVIYASGSPEARAAALAEGIEVTERHYERATARVCPGDAVKTAVIVLSGYETAGHREAENIKAGAKTLREQAEKAATTPHVPAPQKKAKSIR
jgi:hypothetical protein